MIILDATTRSLEIDLDAVVATNQLPFVASYVDINQSTFAMSAMSTNTGASNSTTAVTLVAAPGATTSRQLKYLSVKNSDTAAVLLWIQLNDNTTLREIWKGTLAVGDTLVYVDSLGFNVINSSGQIKTTTATAGIGTIGSSTDNALVRWDGTGGTNVQNSGWTLADTNVLTAGDNLALGSNYISNGGTDAGLSFDGSNNATLSGTLTVTGATITTGSTTALDLATSTQTMLRVLNTYKVSALGSADDTANSRTGAFAFSSNTANSIVYGYIDMIATGAGGAGGRSADMSFWTKNNAAGTFFEQVRILHTDSVTNYLALTGSNGAGAVVGTSANALAFQIATAEKARITASGYFKASNSGSYFGSTSTFHESVSNDGTNAIHAFLNTHATTPNGVYVAFNAAPDNNTQYFLYCADDQDGTPQARTIIYSDGDLQNHDNSYTGLSDASLKTNIVDAKSQLDDFRKYRFRNYDFISDIEAGKKHTQIGLIAQEVLPISPGLVFVGADDMYGLQYSVLAVKAAKALQETIFITDNHESRLKALEARL